MTMTNILPNSAQKVQDFLHGNGFDFRVRELPGSTRTAAEAAKSIGCSVGQIAKSLIFKDKKSERLVLIIASGSNQVDLKKVENATGLQLRQADGKIVKDRVGFAIGGIPPVGHNTPLPTFLDPDLRKYASVWAAAGTPFSVFELPVEALEDLTKGQWLDLAR